MNRQQRRLQAREVYRKREFNMRYAREIRQEKQELDERVIETYMLCIALALHNLYGWKTRGVCRVLNEFYHLICSIDNVNESFQTLTKELYEKTGIEFQWTNYPAVASEG